MSIDWTALSMVLLVSLGAVAALTSLFALGVRAMANRELAGERGAASLRLVAIGCFTVCAAVVLYGLYLLIS